MRVPRLCRESSLTAHGKDILVRGSRSSPNCSYSHEERGGAPPNNLIVGIDMKYLVVDLEATCSDDGSITAENMEIIEIGACWASPSGEVLQRFQQFVKPLVNPTLTPFCRTLTGISQSDIDAAPLFATAAEKLFRFAEEHSVPQSVWMSWGAYDLKQLVKDSSLHEVKFPIAFPHQNAKKMFAKIQKIGKEVGMAKACELAGFSLLGQHHRGLDDAVNIARLLPFILGHSQLRKSKTPPI